MSENKPEISIHEIVVNEKKFFCSFSEQKEFRDFIGKIKGDEVKVKHLHSIKASYKKCDDKSDSVYVYDTLTLTKMQALGIFDRMAYRFKDMCKIIWDTIEECPETEACLKFITSLQHPEKDVLLKEFYDFTFHLVMGFNAKETDEKCKIFQDHLERIMKEK